MDIGDIKEIGDREVNVPDWEKSRPAPKPQHQPEREREKVPVE